MRQKRSMFDPRRSRLVVLGLLILSVAFASQADAWFDRDPLFLRFIGSFPGADSIQVPHGWPITIEATARERELLGIGTPWVPPIFPEEDTVGYIVFDDPDGCPSFLTEDIQASIICYGGAGTCTAPPGSADCAASPPTIIEPWPTDEEWMEITPGMTTRDTFCVEEACEESRTVDAFDSNTGDNDREYPVDPSLGSIYDDYGYGANPRLPGMFVSSTVGPSVITDSGTYQKTCKNIAGFFQSVGYQLSNPLSRTSVRTHLNVPPSLFRPVIQIDNGFECQVSDPEPDECKSKYQIDGGPPVVVDPAIGLLDSVVNELEVKVKAFVIDVEDELDYPDSLVDMDFDGDCDANDAESMGYNVISNQTTLRFVQYYLEFTGIGYDFDDDDFVGTIVLPAGPGGLTGPPR